MALSMLREITRPYSLMESWSYDRFVAPGMLALFSEFRDGLSARLPTGARVLDVGCGGGQIAAALAACRSDVSIECVDLSPEQIGRAQRRFADHDQLNFRVASAESLPFDSETFDMVISIGCLKHWPQQAKGVSECVRCLKPGGFLFLTEIDRGCRLEDLNRLIVEMPVPRPLRPLVLMIIRTYVAGQSVDVGDVGEILEDLRDFDGDVQRLTNGGLSLSGHRVPVPATPEQTPQL